MRSTETADAAVAQGIPTTTATTVGRFVVHQHHARRMHYDLRIEISGTLKSFAVPKGPSLDPAQKHLALLTEDHPFEYLEFEAVIPAGNYGAGAMILWDTGHIYYLDGSAEQGLAQGKLDFMLHGFKLRGRFGLIEIRPKPGDKQRSWLLVKKADAHAAAALDILAERPRSVLSGLTVHELPHTAQIAQQLAAHARDLGALEQPVTLESVTPMRCAEEGGRLDDPDSVYELKLDGVRLLAERHGEHVQLRFRTQRSATALFPELVRALLALPCPHFILDGEVVAFDARGLPSFAHVAERIHKQDPRDIFLAARKQSVQFLAFDVLALEHWDLRSLPLLARKQLLAELVRGDGYVRALSYAVGRGQALFQFCEAHNLEGLIQKHAHSSYESAKSRSPHWLKIKRTRDDDFVVVGFTRGKGNRGDLGALDIASYVNGVLRTRGKVGSGFDHNTISQLVTLLTPLAIPACAAQGELMPAPQGRVFVKPSVVVSVTHAGFTEDGRLRHPVFRGVRNDVQPSECQAATEQERERALEAPPPPRSSHTASSGAQARPRVQLTNAHKIFWPGEGITKGALYEYYDRVSDYLLPYLRDRPVLIERYPDGITGKHFFQWSAPRGVPSWVRTEVIESEEGRDITYFRVDDRDTLLYIANLGTIPLHILAGRFSSLDDSDFLTIDFDLGEAPFEHAITLARALHDLLTELDLPSYPKTSGQTGLHVLVPMGGAPHSAAVALAGLLGRLLHERHAAISTIARMRRDRPQVVYIDTGQTGRSRAIVAPYAVRAAPGATVSTPLTWDEVTAGLVPARHHIASVPDRLAQRGDPMAEMRHAKPDLPGALSALQALLSG